MIKMEQLNFVYFNKAYPINLPIFEEHSTFFSRGNQINNRNINLLNEKDFCTTHTDESIEAFLNYCQDRPIELRVNTVISIQALSIKLLC